MGSWKGDPAPAGLFAFGATCFVLSCYTAGLPDIRRPPSATVNIITGMALFHGGLLQILVGVCEMFCHNTLSATIFTSYGAYWLSYSALLIPCFGVTAAYDNFPDRVLGNAIGILLVGWAIWTLILTIASLRSSLGIIFLFLSSLVTFILLAASSFAGAAQNLVLHRSAGFCGIVAGMSAFCNAFHLLLASKDPFWTTESTPQKQETVDAPVGPPESAV